MAHNGKIITALGFTNFKLHFLTINKDSFSRQCSSFSRK